MVTRLTGIVSLILISASALIIHANPATGYELSIYASTPILAFVFLFLGYAGGLGIIIYYALVKPDSGGRLWYLGFFIILTAVAVIVGLPLLKGYAFYGYADNLTHVGWAKDISAASHFSRDNFYPVMHIWASSLARIAGIPEATVIKYMPAVVSLLFIVFTYLLAAAVFWERGKAMLTGALASIFIFSSGYEVAVPNSTSVMLSPFVVFLYFKARSKDTQGNREMYLLFFIAFLVLYPFFHPLTTIMLFVFLVSLEISFKTYSFFKAERYSISLNPPLILSITFLAWFSSYTIWNRSVLAVGSWLSGAIRPYTIAGEQESMDKLGLTALERVTLPLKMYGVDIALFLLATVAAALIVKRLRSSRREEMSTFALLGCFVFSSIFVAFLLGTSFPGIQVTLNINWVFMLSIPLAGYILFETGRFMINRMGSSMKVLSTGVAATLIMSLFFVSFLKVFPSPYRYLPSEQILQARLDGTRWFFDSKSPRMPAHSMDIINLGRFVGFTYGSESNIMERERDLGGMGLVNVFMPSHFGYDRTSAMGDLFQGRSYLVLGVLEQAGYTRVWQRYGRYTGDDFAALDRDPSLDKLYSNGGFSVRMIHGAPALGKL